MAHSATTIFSTLLLLFLGYHIVTSLPGTDEVLLGSPDLRGRGGADPVLDANFADPSIFRDEDGQWYAFATEGNGRRVQAAQAPAAEGPWRLLEDVDLLPRPAAWATGRFTWAPSVSRLDDGTYVMYYSAQLAADKPFHAVGAATAGSVLGPYTPTEGGPLAGGGGGAATGGGAIDPSGFRDDADGGRRYVVYKVDGNSLGAGGPCGGADPPFHPTPIMLQEVSPADGVTPLGEPTAIFDRTDADGPLVEAPSLLRAPDGRYVLFYSSGCFSDASYRTSYAIARSVTGPYTRSGRPIMRSGDRLGLTAPGGAAATSDGDVIVFHADCPQGRCMHVTSVKVNRFGGVKLGV